MSNAFQKQRMLFILILQTWEKDNEFSNMFQDTLCRENTMSLYVSLKLIEFLGALSRYPIHIISLHIRKQWFLKEINIKRLMCTFSYHMLKYNHIKRVNPLIFLLVLQHLFQINNLPVIHFWSCRLKVDTVHFVLIFKGTKVHKIILSKPLKPHKQQVWKRESCKGESVYFLQSPIWLFL